jgi:hypothetical protein
MLRQACPEPCRRAQQEPGGATGLAIDEAFTSSALSVGTNS